MKKYNEGHFLVEELATNKPDQVVSEIFYTQSDESKGIKRLANTIVKFVRAKSCHSILRPKGPNQQRSLDRDFGRWRWKGFLHLRPTGLHHFHEGGDNSRMCFHFVKGRQSIQLLPPLWRQCCLKRWTYRRKMCMLNSLDQLNKYYKNPQLIN